MFCNSNLLVRVSRSFQGIRSFATSIPKLAAEESNDGNLPGSNYSEKTINSVTLLGRIGADAVKRGSVDHPVVIFNLATHSQYSYSNGDVNKKTEWHRICVFKPYLMENSMKFAIKGQRVLVQGRLIYGEVKDGEGILRQTSSVVADDVIYFKTS